MTAQRLAHFQSFRLPIAHHLYPSHYPPGFPALLAPAYWLPHAPLSAGIIGVGAFGVIAVLLVYTLARLMGGIVAGLGAAGALIVSPQFARWAHEIMSETATIALVAASCLLLYLSLQARTRRARTGFLALLGLCAGIGALVHLTNAILIVPALVVVVIARPFRGERVRSAAATSGGWLLCLGGLALYNQATFGQILATGYGYWDHAFYGHLNKVFALRYALKRPVVTGDYDPSTGIVPNAEYYIRSIAGLWPHASTLLLTKGLFVLAVIGSLYWLRDRRFEMRGLALYAGLTIALIFTVYAVYSFQSVRFLAPIVVPVAIACGLAAGRAVGMVKGGLSRVERWPIAIGAVIAALMVFTYPTAAAQTIRASYLFRQYRGYDRGKVVIAPNADTAELYKRVPRNSIVITSVAALFLSEDGIFKRDHVIPLVHGPGWSYWSMPLLRQVPTFAMRQSLISQAIQHHGNVYIDQYSLSQLHQTVAEDRVALHALRNYHLLRSTGAGQVTLYRLQI